MTEVASSTGFASYGAFSRSVPLPTGISEKDLHAAFKEGVLRIEIPKSEERKPRAIAVK